MNKRILLSLVASTSLVLGATNAQLEERLNTLSKEFQAYKANASQNTETKSENTEDTFESFSDLGVSASKVYQSESALSIGGYGEYKYKKYNGYKNTSNADFNARQNTSETNVVRFVPYIGYKFNDWIVMNTEIEFENGGAKTTDDGKEYKYAIVEFSYLDFLLDEKYNIRVGHILTPFGNINLNHEPVAFLTAERPLVETFIIPSTWHTNGALLFGEIEGVDYYTGVITSPDANEFVGGRYIQQGRRGARQFTDDLSFVGRLSYKGFAGIDIGSSLFYGKSSVDNSDTDLTMFMSEAHISYKANGWNVQALGVMGTLSDYETLANTVAGSVHGAYTTVGYDFFHSQNTEQKLYGVAEIEILDLDADNETANPDHHKYNEYTFGIAYFPSPKVVIKAEYNIRDYKDSSSLADEKAVIASLGFIF